MLFPTRRTLLGTFLGIFLVLTPTASATSANNGPMAVSPGAIGLATEILQPCPTFSWDPVMGAQGHELVVYKPGNDEESHQSENVVLNLELPGSASAWTPPLGLCLQRGQTYAWSVRALQADGPGEWAGAHIFRVTEQVFRADVQEAIRVLRAYLLEQGLTPEEVSHIGQDSLYDQAGARDVAKRKVGVTEQQTGAAFSVDGTGNVMSTSVTGDGSGLTNLDPTNLSAGTAGIDITGTSSNVTGVVAISNGGTGAVSAAGARTNLQVAPASGSSSYVDIGGDLMTGDLAFSDLNNNISSGGVNLNIAAEAASTSDLQLFANDLVEIDADDDIVLEAENNIEMFVGVGGSVMVNGGIVHTSDRNLKENLRPVNSRQVLRTVLQLPITYWNFREDPSEALHLGPTAQDFHAFFGLGAHERYISAVDADGVNMAALKGLHAVLQEKLTELERIRAETQRDIEGLAERLSRLETLLDKP